MREPASIVRKYGPKIPPGNVLDLGCGEGGNVLFLAARGYNVIAVDRRADVLEELRNEAAKQSYAHRITVLQEDIRNAVRHLDGDDPHYTGVVCTFTLHYFPQPVRRNLITALKADTIPNGIHIIAGLTTRGKRSIVHGLTIDELQAYYSDWKQLCVALEPMGGHKNDSELERALVVARKT